MKTIIRQIICGKDAKISGLFALSIVGLIVLGCTCNKDFLNSRKNDTNSTGPTNRITTPESTATPKASVPTNSRGETPSDPEAEAIVQETLQDFASSVDSGDFSNFHTKSSKGFKRTYTAESVKTNFISFVNQKNRVVPILRSTASMTPYYTLKPAVTTERGLKVFRANGSYSTSPATSFEFEYLLEDKMWKIIGIRIRMQ